MILNGVMAVTLHYFTEFGKPALLKAMCGRIYASVYCIFSACTMSSQRKFTFAISSPDEFLVILCGTLLNSPKQLCVVTIYSNLFDFAQKKFWTSSKTFQRLKHFYFFPDVVTRKIILHCRSHGHAMHQTSTCVRRTLKKFFFNFTRNHVLN